MNTAHIVDALTDRRQVLKNLALAAGTGALISQEIFWTGRSVLANDPKVSGDWGTVKGRIAWDESTPAPKRTEIDLKKYNLTEGDREYFTSKGKLLAEDWVIDPKTLGLKNTFVWLRPESPKIDASITTIHPSLTELKVKDLIMDQEALGYNPHAVAARVGQTLLLKNSSPIAHAIVWNSDANGSGNISSPSKSEYRFKELKAEKYPIALSCAPHPWERAWVRVFDHPYFAITDKDGNFEIKLAPGGKLRLVVWQETLGFKDGKAGRLGQPITVEAGATLDLGVLKVKEV